MTMTIASCGDGCSLKECFLCNDNDDFLECWFLACGDGDGDGDGCFLEECFLCNDYDDDEDGFLERWYCLFVCVNDEWWYCLFVCGDGVECWFLVCGDGDILEWCFVCGDGVVEWCNWCKEANDGFREWPTTRCKESSQLLSLLLLLPNYFSAMMLTKQVIAIIGIVR